MTKSELIVIVAGKQHLPKVKAEQIVDCVFESMEAALKRGGRVELRGFGSFEVRQYMGYDGRNPKTGVHIVVMPKRQAFFKVGKALKDRVTSAGTETTLTAARRVAL